MDSGADSCKTMTDYVCPADPSFIPSDYYVIQDRRYNAFLYILYINGAIDPAKASWLLDLFR